MELNYEAFAKTVGSEEFIPPAGADPDDYPTDSTSNNQDGMKMNIYIASKVASALMSNPSIITMLTDVTAKKSEIASVSLELADELLQQDYNNNNV